MKRLLGYLKRSAPGGAGGAPIMANYVQGPAVGGSTNNAVVRWDGTTGRLVQNSGVQISDADVLSIPSTSGSAFEFYNVGNVGDANYERLKLSYNAPNLRYEFEAQAGGTGAARNIRMVTGQGHVTVTTNAISMSTGGGTSGSTPVTISSGTLSSTSLVQKGVEITQTVNQTSGTGGYDALTVNPTLTAVGSAGANLLRLRVSSVDMFRVSSAGALTAASFASFGGAGHFLSGTALPAGGTVSSGIRFFSTSNFGVFGGSGAPTLSAAKGSLYLRSDGTGTNDRAYINTDGGTTWTALVTVA